MVLTTIADITLDITIWSVKKVYGIGYWFIYGNVKSETDMLLEKQNKTIELLHEDLLKINKRLEKIEDIDNKYQNYTTFLETDDPVEIINTNDIDSKEFEIIDNK